MLTRKQNIVDHIMGCVPEDVHKNIVHPKHNLPPVNFTHNENGVTSPSNSTSTSKVVGVSPCPSLNPLLSVNASSKCCADATTVPPSPGKSGTPYASSSTQTSWTAMRDVWTNTTSNIEDDGAFSLELYESYAQTSTEPATSAASVEDESSANTPRASHTRGLSNATTLRGSTSRNWSPVPILPDGEFRRKLEDEYQLLAEIQGQQDRRAVEKDRDAAEDGAKGIGSQFEGSEQGALEEQSETYEALLTKAKQDGKDALAARQDEHEDQMKYLQKDLDKVAGRKVLVEKRLKKVLLGQKTIKEENHSLSLRCKAQEENIAHKDVQLQSMLSVLQNRQQQLDDLTARFNVISAEANENAQVVEASARTIPDLRQTIQILVSQLTPIGQIQQAPEVSLVGELRIENARLLGVIASLQAGNEVPQAQDGSWKEKYTNCAIEASRKALHRLLRLSEHDISELVQIISKAKREHDSWTNDQLSGSPEDPLGNKTKVANHLAHKDKLYQDLEKRFQDCSDAFEEYQKKTSEEKKETISCITSLRKELGEQKQVVESVKGEEKLYRKETGKLLEMLQGKLHKDDLVNAMSYHFDLLRDDNSILVAKVGELDEEIKGLKQEGTRHERNNKGHVKKLDARQETVRELEDAKKVLESKLDSLTYMAEVAEECHKEEIKKSHSHINALSSELTTTRDTLSNINRYSATERILWELNSKDEFIYSLKSELVKVHNALALACRERDYFHHVSGFDDCLAACHDKNFVVLQRKLRIEEAKVAELEGEVANADPLRLKEARKYKEAWEPEQLRIQELEKELYQLHQNLEGKVTNTPQDTPSAAEQTEDMRAVLEDLATRLWTRMLGLEDTLRALGRSIIEPNNERAELRLACAGLLGLHEEEWEGPGDTTSESDGREVEVVSGE